MKKVELLAPAGSMDALKSAVMAGCDAVYIGGKNFGARAYSSNFDNEEIVDAINYCHLYGVKVYVTCNTLIYEDEVDDFLNYVRFLHQNGVDAIIIQDLGMLDLVRQTFPNLEIHASTQMHIHNLDGVQFLEKMGVKRVVLARETSIENIKNIIDNSNMEIEIFAHGSLCVSYSGQCLMSSLIGNRSGNRGCCRGDCRLAYDVVNKNNQILNNDKYPLSMKDLCTVYNVGELIDMNVTSLKIEGRMKSPSYVYLVTKLYREAIDAWYQNHIVFVNEQIMNELKKVFNRQYTKGFLFNEENNAVVNMKRPNHQGVLIGQVVDYKRPIVKIKLQDDLHIDDGLRIVGTTDVGVKVNEFYLNNMLVKEAKKSDIVSLKIKSDVSVGSDVLLTSSSYIDNKIKDLVNKRLRKVKINGQIIIKKGEKLQLTVVDNNEKIRVDGNIVQKAKTIPITKEIIEKQLKKLGDTVYEWDNLEIILDKGVFVSIKELNDLRRALTLKLNKKRLKIKEFKEEKYLKEVPDFPRKFIKTCLIEDLNKYQLVSKNDYDIIYCPQESSKTVLQYPRVVNEYKEHLEYGLVGEIGAFNKIKNVDTDVYFNVLNSYTVAFLHHLGAKKITLSYELSKEQIKNIVSSYEQRYHKHPNLEVVVYRKEELMISKFNLNDYYQEENLGLKNKFGDIYQIKNKNGLMVIYNHKITDLRNVDYYSLGVNAVRETL